MEISLCSIALVVDNETAVWCHFDCHIIRKPVNGKNAWMRLAGRRNRKIRRSENRKRNKQLNNGESCSHRNKSTVPSSVFSLFQLSFEWINETLTKSTRTHIHHRLRDYTCSSNCRCLVECSFHFHMNYCHLWFASPHRTGRHATHAPRTLSSFFLPFVDLPRNSSHSITECNWMRNM